MYCAEEIPQQGFNIKWSLSLRHIIRQQTGNSKTHTREMRTVQAKQQTGREEGEGEVRFKKRGKNRLLSLSNILLPINLQPSWMKRLLPHQSFIHACYSHPTHPPVVTHLGPRNIHHERGWIDGEFCSSTKVASNLWVY
jgi:hypothetical protein